MPPNPCHTVVLMLDQKVSEKIRDSVIDVCNLNFEFDFVEVQFYGEDTVMPFCVIV